MADENRWGTVFMGPTSDRESRLDKISNREEQDLWNRRTEAEYLRRVKERAVEQLNAMLTEAQEQAAGLLAAAQADADNIRQAAEELRTEARQDREAAAAELENARSIRAEAYNEGYDRGVEQAMLELEEQRAAIDATTLAVLQAMESQCGNLFSSWRDELAALLRQSVETGLGWVLTEERAAVLETLLCKAVDTLENQRRITVRANPADAPAVEEVLNSVRSRFSDLKAWEVKSDETLAAGGLVVESVSGRVESRAETRREIVEQTLRHLTLPESEADAEATAAVLAIADKAGVPALEQAVHDAEQKALARHEAAALEQPLPPQGSVSTEQSSPEHETPEQPLTEQSSPEHETPEQPLTEQPLPEHVAPEQPVHEQAADEQAESAAPSASESGAPHAVAADAIPAETPPRPKRPPTPKNPAMAALPQGETPDVAPDGLSEDAEFDNMAKEIARSMMFGGASESHDGPEGQTAAPAHPVHEAAETPPPAHETVEAPDHSPHDVADEPQLSPKAEPELEPEPEEDNGGFVGAPDFAMPDFDSMTIEEAEAMARKLLEAQN